MDDLRNLQIVQELPGVMTVVEFDNTDDIVKYVEWGRIYGGMHYRTSTVRGKVIAQKVARYVAANYFLPVR